MLDFRAISHNILNMPFSALTSTQLLCDKYDSSAIMHILPVATALYQYSTLKNNWSATS